jgi:SAM-dependent methyltransferase
MKKGTKDGLKKSYERFFKEKIVYDLLYGKLVLDDFVPLIKYNILNMNVENHVFHDLSFENIIDILNDELIRYTNYAGENFLNIASGAGKITILAAMMYNFENFFGVDNIQEMHLMAKHLLDKAAEDTGMVTRELAMKKISFFLKDPLFVEFNEYKLIVVDHNNSNEMYNIMLQNKLEREVKLGSIIIRIYDPFEENKHLKLLKTRIFTDISNREFMVFFYEKK